MQVEACSCQIPLIFGPMPLGPTSKRPSGGGGIPYTYYPLIQSPLLKQMCERSYCTPSTSMGMARQP